jgi:acetyl-CoA synthetase
MAVGRSHAYPPPPPTHTHTPPPTKNNTNKPPKHQWSPKHVSWNFDTRKGPIRAEFFKGATTNICHNALDRHVLAGNGDRDCFLWEGNDPGRDRRLTYKQVLSEVCRLANWLRAQGVKKGDAVSIYMPMLCELPIAMLACARIGAVHSVVFGGFSAEALAQRVGDCKAKVLITCSGVKRGEKRIGLKAIADEAVELSAKRGHKVERVLVCENDNGLPKAETPFVEGRDGWWRDEVAPLSDQAQVEWVDAEHPLFLLYTSGSTGKPKGVLHTTGGYMVGVAVTTRHAFCLRPGDVWFCTADCG